MADKYVSICELARYLGRDKCTMRRRIQKQGIQTMVIRRSDSGQSIQAISAKDAKVIMAGEPQMAELVAPESIAKEKARG